MVTMTPKIGRTSSRRANKSLLILLLLLVPSVFVFMLFHLHVNVLPDVGVMGKGRMKGEREEMGEMGMRGRGAEVPREAPIKAPLKSPVDIVREDKNEEKEEKEKEKEKEKEEKEKEDYENIHDDHHDDDGRIVRGSGVGGTVDKERVLPPPPPVPVPLGKNPIASMNSFFKPSSTVRELDGDSTVVNKGRKRDSTKVLTRAYERFKSGYMGRASIGGREGGKDKDTTGMVKGLLHEDGDSLHWERTALEKTFPEQKSMYATLKKQLGEDYNDIYNNFTVVLHPSEDAAILGSMIAANHQESKVVVLCNGAPEELDECVKNSTRGEYGNLLVGLSDVNRVAKHLEQVGEAEERRFASYQVFGDLARVCKGLLPYECENEIGR
jgi:hypothetical protein